MSNWNTNDYENGKHYVFGDLHGARATLEKIIKDKQIDLEKDFVYFVGDYYFPLKYTSNDDKKLFEYLNEYYQMDLNRPGFHLVRGNHEWWPNHLDECFGQIAIRHLPDIIRLKIDEKYEFVIAHSGMSKEVYEFMEKQKLFSAQLDTNWVSNLHGRKYYNQIIWTKKEEEPTYKDAEKIGENIFVIHGHCPVSNFEGNNNCGYTIIKKDQRGIAAVNAANWIDIDVGIKEGNRSLSYICLEDFISNYENKKDLNLAVEKCIVNTLYVKENFEKEEKNFDTNRNSDKDGNYCIEKIILNNEKKLEINKDEKIDLEYINLHDKDDKYSEFVKAMKIVAKAKCNELSEIENKENINCAIATIIEFVRNNSSANLMVRNMFGFITKDRETAVVNKDEWVAYLNNMSLKQYLYFVADMKIKATIYLLRIHHFIYRNREEIDFELDIEDKIRTLEIREIGDFFGEQLNEEYKGRESIEDILNKLANEEGNDIKNNDKTTKKCSDGKKYIEYCIEYLQETDKEKKKERALQAEQLENKILELKVEENQNNKNEDVNMLVFQNYLERIDKKQGLLLDDTYYLFDNSMREIEFCGIEWRWMWRYEQGKSDLFRCVGTDEFTYLGTLQEQGREYYEKMIKNVVNHMNPGEYKTKLASYSKNPYRDIYKYMNYKSDCAYVFTIENDKVNLEAILDEKSDDKPNETVTFAIVNQADTNIIKKVEVADKKGDFTIKIKDSECEYKVNNEEDIKSFSQFILDSERENETGDESKKYIFCVDILNNKAPYTGDVRMAFKNYTDQFPDETIQGLVLSKVSSWDEEVVMSGNTCSAIVKVDSEEKSKGSYSENTEYRIELNQMEMIALFRAMWLEKDNQNMDVEKYEKKMLFKKIKLTKSNSHKENPVDEYDIYIINDKISVKIEKKKDDFQNENEFSQKTEEEKKKEEKEKENKRLQYMKEKIAEHIAEITCVNTSWKVEFIMKFVRKYQKYKNYGNSVYKPGDALVDLCKQLYLK